MSTTRPCLTGRIIGPLAGLVVVLALSALAAPAQAAYPGANGKIAFNEERGAQRDIYTMNPDGTGRTQLIGGCCAVWSPDGTRIAFLRPGSIYVANSDGTGERSLNVSGDPVTWSPDGQKIASSACTDGGHGGCTDSGIFTINVDGSGYTRFPNAPEPFESYVDWSPDGSKLAFQSTSSTDGRYNIWTVNADGTGFRQLTSGPADDVYPSWSPDGKRIAFQSGLLFTPPGCGTCRDEIYVMDADGGNQTRLTDNAVPDDLPVWSPDGTKIAFTRFEDCTDRCSHGDIYTMNADGTGELNLTANPPGSQVFDFAPDWQPLHLNRPPDCSEVTATPSLLSPADRSLPLVRIGGATDPDGDTVALTITAVTQDEPLTGDGDNTGQDAFSKYFTSDPYLASLLENKRNEVYLRAESRKHGDGRVYRIAFTGSDGRGGTCTGTASARAPSPKGLTIDSAPPSYNSFGP